MGRRKRKNKRQGNQKLTTIEALRDTIPSSPKLSFGSDGFSTDSTKERIQLLSDKLFETILDDKSTLSLKALNRIIQGKEGDERPCFEDGDFMTINDDTSNDREDTSNPLVVTNYLLQKSNALPLLATAMAQTLVSVLKIDEELIFERVQIMAEILNNACLMNDDNRFAIIENGKLIPAILKLLVNAPPERYEVMLVATSLLTSVTHENEAAADQLLITYTFEEGTFSRTSSGLDVLTDLLFDLIKQKQHGAEYSKHRYDLLLFSLPTLTNTLDTGNVAVALSKTKTPTNIPFLKFLTRWIVDQTEPFREKILSSNASKDEFNEAWKENLNMAGNGCIFLACVLTADVDSACQTRIKNQILSQTPTDKDGSRVTLIKNTARAYCNFYHFYMGVLTHEVVTAVKKLLGKLENTDGSL